MRAILLFLILAIAACSSSYNISTYSLNNPATFGNNTSTTAWIGGSEGVLNVTGWIGVNNTVVCLSNGTNCQSNADGMWNITGSNYLYNSSTVLNWNESKGNSTYVNVAGDTMAGDLLMGDFSIFNTNQMVSTFLNVSTIWLNSINLTTLINEIQGNVSTSLTRINQVNTTLYLVNDSSIHRITGDTYLTVANGSTTNLTANLAAFDLRYIQSETDPKWSGNASRVSDLETANISANSRIDSLNTTKAQAGTCAPGKFLENVTATGVQCNTPSGSGDILSVQGDGVYIYNGSDSGSVHLEFNETNLNNTIDARAGNATSLNNSLNAAIANISRQSSNISTFYTNSSAYLVNISILTASLGDSIANTSTYLTNTSALTGNVSVLWANSSAYLNNISQTNANLNGAIGNISNKLDLSGGFMTGDINISNHRINISEITGSLNFGGNRCIFVAANGSMIFNNNAAGVTCP